MTRIHIVQPGEHLSAIAMRHGFADYRSLWYDGGNAGLRQQRKNPNVLLAGDRVVIPERKERVELRPTDKRHRFVKEGQPLRLRVRLLDEARQAVTGLSAELAVDGMEIVSRSLGRDGQVEREVVKPAAAGRVTVNPRAAVKKNIVVVRAAAAAKGAPATARAPARAAAPAAPGAEAGAPAATEDAPVRLTLPEPGCENEMGAEVPVVDQPPDESPPPPESNTPSVPAAPDPLQLPRPELSALIHTVATWIEVDLTLGIGELDPIDTPSGQLHRLHNLGYEPGPPVPPVTEEDRRRQRSAIEEFQCDHGLAVDGVCGPATQGKLLQVHGC